MNLEEGLHLGFRKTKAGSGGWLMRTRTEAGAYREQRIGTADDHDDADGSVVLSYSQAQAKARAARITAERRQTDSESDRRGPYTVTDAIADYEADYIRRGKKAMRTVRSIAKAHIEPALGSIALAKLTKDRISRWHAGLADAHAMMRSGAGKTRNLRTHEASDADAVRRRRSSANRILTVLKAALNLAFAEGMVASDTAWRRVKPFRGVDAARVRSLSQKEASRLLTACDPEFRALVRASLLTGCRYGELARLKLADIDFRAQTLLVSESKSGKPRHVPLTVDGTALFREVIGERQGVDLVFKRTSFAKAGGRKGRPVISREWKLSECSRTMDAASARAGIVPGVTFHELRHTYASSLASSGVPIAFIAEALGHADTRVTSKHYAHLAPSSVANAIRNALPSFSVEAI